MDPQYENLIAEGQQGRTDEHAEDTGGRQTSQGSKKDHDHRGSGPRSSTIGTANLVAQHGQREDQAGSNENVQELPGQPHFEVEVRLVERPHGACPFSADTNRSPALLTR